MRVVVLEHLFGNFLEHCSRTKVLEQAFQRLHEMAALKATRNGSSAALNRHLYAALKVALDCV